MSELARKGAPLVVLSRPEQLAQYEAIVAEGEHIFLKVAKALNAIKTQELYREKGYDDWPAYIDAEWPQFKSRRYTDYLIEADRSVQAIEAHNATAPEPLPLPASERSVRPLAKVPEPKRAPVWQEAVQTARQQGRETPTQRDTESAVGKFSTGEEKRDLAGVDGFKGHSTRGSFTYIEPSRCRALSDRLLLTVIRPATRTSPKGTTPNIPLLLLHVDTLLRSVGKKIVDIDPSEEADHAFD